MLADFTDGHPDVLAVLGCVRLRRAAPVKNSSPLLRLFVGELKIERVTPHDLRRTCLTWITRLGFGRDAMDRVANHRTSTVTDVYDRHGYADEDNRRNSTTKGRPLRRPFL